RHQRHQRGEQHHPEQLALHRAAAAGPGRLRHAAHAITRDGQAAAVRGPRRHGLASTLRATDNRRALIFRLACSAGVSATSKRTLSSTTTKLTMLPWTKACSDSVTVSTGWP